MPVRKLLEKGKSSVVDRVKAIETKLNSEDGQKLLGDLAEAKAKMSQFADSASSKAKDHIMEEIEEAINSIDEWVAKAKGQMTAWVQEKRQLFTRWLEEVREKVHLWVLERVEEMLNAGFDRLLPRLKEQVKDPYAPKIIHMVSDRVFDALWFDIKEECIEIIVGGFRPPVRTSSPLPPQTCLRKMRAAVRYALFPYDKSVWQNFRNPAFLLFKVLCLVPFPGLLQALWFLVFLVIDKGDEFQLLQYILSFKALQFVTMGVVKTVIGAALFFSCVTKEPPNCDETWGVSTWESFGLAFLMLQVVLVWCAFAFLPSSKQKGSYHVLLKADHQRRGIVMEDGVYQPNVVVDDKKDNATGEEYPALGHRMMKWLLYDAVVFAVCVALGVVSMFAHANARARVVGDDREGGVVSNWRFTATLFWLQALYGMCAFPFIIFTVPILSTVFTHAKATGYDKQGTPHFAFLFCR
ncbi:hypothetical protein DIPPA_20530 [Diplonema papillatum]|nr:hypothetical protein DIPPA_20530 [Diplonema papillatum]